MSRMTESRMHTVPKNLHWQTNFFSVQKLADD